ncbi:uncharacterized protein [Temnothorax nylanderi]|uniref:uncharacterized protein isoform X2 n=1 Tax=Temnothorax nylanderi TaxID=102681 RepID=UPI003A889F75
MKLQFARPKYFTEAIAPMTTVNYVLGLRVFEYPRGHPRPVLSLIYLLFIYVIYCGGHLRLQKEYYANIRLMKLEYVLYQLLMYIVVVSVILKMLLGWWHTKKFKVCYKKIFEIDETLRQLRLTVNYDRIYFVTIGVITAWIILAIIACTLVFLHLQKRTDLFTSLYLMAVYMYSFTVNSVNIFEFYIFARCLQMKFGLINKLLCESLTNLSVEEIKLGIFEIKDFAEIMDTEQRKQILSTKTLLRWRRRVQSRLNVFMSEKQDSAVFQIKSHVPSQLDQQFQNVLRNRSQRHNPNPMTKCQKRRHMLQIIRQVHLELCKVSKIVCTILGVQTALEMAVIVMFLTGALYNLYIRYIMNQHIVKGLVEKTSGMLILFFLHIVKAVALNRVCKYAADEGNKTIEIIHAIYGCDADTDMQEEIQQFGIQILQSPVTFSAFGLTLDNRVLSMILKNVTTYLVIILQVSNTLESNNAIEYSHF